MVICLERGADLHMAQRIPLPLTVSCFSKIQIGFTFLDKGSLNGCVCVCGRHGTAERVYRLEFVSNHPFTDSEFNKWRETMMLSGLSLPSVYDIEKKVTDIKFAMNYSFKESDIEQVTLNCRCWAASD